ncbi:3-oxo-5-alpha-steroid 4-dehydrogenase [Coniothyrium glycines]
MALHPPPASSLLAQLGPVALLRAFYLAASLLILVIQAVPALRNRFLAYGSRATTSRDTDEPAVHRPSPVSNLLDHVATVQVPHNWFTHFYVISVACSLFWGCRLRLWDTDVAGTQQSVVWSLMLLQGVRRMLESYTFTSSSKSKMWFAHWLLGLIFYLTVNVAVWIETPKGRHVRTAGWCLVPGILNAHVLQNTYHRYFYQLRAQNKGYQLPEGIFGDTLCPHYFWEIMIYAQLSFLAAPAGNWVNWTLVCATVFVATNLGVTAIGTKQWYLGKFGAHKVAPKKRMIPFLW